MADLRTAKPFNDFQVTAKTYYCKGEFSAVENMSEVEKCGDGMFIFIMNELSTASGCDSNKEAHTRLGLASSQLLNLAPYLSPLKEESCSSQGK